MQGGLLAAGGLCDWRGENAVLTDVGLPLSSGGFGEDDPGSGCLEEVGAAVRPEPPVLTLLPDRPTSRARCGRGMYLPSLENEMQEKEVVRRSPGLRSVLVFIGGVAELLQDSRPVSGQGVWMVP